ncbi:MAG: ATP-binding cassette domain-containing protein [Bacteroidetes bacterium]|nr:ATP-binding cassette domain-containing protein [Bacteroidota bacterium]
MLKAEIDYFTYLGKDKPTLKNSGINLSGGGLYLLWGDNGEGKSTLAYILSGVIPFLLKGELKGKVLYEGERLGKDIIGNLSLVVFQNPYIFFQGQTIKEEFQPLLDANHCNSKAIINQLLGDFDKEQYIEHLSGGQQQILSICSAALHNKFIYVFDEPFEFLDDYHKGLAITIIKTLADSGKIIFLIQRKPEEIQDLSIKRSFKINDGNIKEELPKYSEKEYNLGYISNDNIILKIQGLNFGYRNRKQVLINGISFDVNEKECLGIIGPNGSGKSTLFLIIAQLLKQNSGTIELNGKLNKEELRRGIKYSFQNPDYQIFKSSVKEEIVFGLEKNFIDAKSIQSKLDLVSTLLPFDLEESPFDLSFGQKKLLTIISTLILDPKLALIDEPFAGLDDVAKSIIIEQFKIHLSKNNSIIISTHSGNEIKGICTRILTLKNGKLE